MTLRIIPSTLAQVIAASYSTIMNAARTPTVDTQLAAFANGDVSFANEPSLSGDTLTWDGTNLPTQVGYTAQYFQVELTPSGESATVYDLLLGAVLDCATDPEKEVRRLRGSRNKAHSARSRIVWRRDTDGVQFAGAWGETLSATTTTTTTPTLEIRMNRTSGYINTGPRLIAELSGSGALRPFFDIDYEWSFPESGIYDKLPADFPFNRERSTAYGPYTAFVFETAGAKTITCTARWRDSNGLVREVTQTATYTVSDFDANDANTEIYTIGSDASDTHTAAELDALITSIQNDGQSAIRVVSFRRGETFTASPGFISSIGVFHMTAHGTGNRPVLTGSWWPADDGIDMRVSCSGVEFRGPYDPTTPDVDEAGINQFRATSIIRPQSFAVVHDCVFSGSDHAIMADDVTDLIVSDVSVTDWRNYGILGSAFIVGSSIKQNPGTLVSQYDRRTATSPPFVAAHGPWRHGGSEVKAAGMYLVDMFSNNSWNTNVIPQTPVRFNSGGIPGVMFSAHSYRSEGAAQTFWATNPNSGFGRSPAPGWTLIDGFVHYGTYDVANGLLTIANGNTTVRNFKLVKDNTPPADAAMKRLTNILAATESDHDRELFDNAYNPVELHFGTIVDLRSDFNAQNGGNQAELPTVEYLLGSASLSDREFEGVVVTDDNIIHVPNRTGSNQRTAYTPLDTTAGHTPNFTGNAVYRSAHIRFSSLTGLSRLAPVADLTGATSGAIGYVYAPNVGNEVWCVMNDRSGDPTQENGPFTVGETVNVAGGGSFVVDAIIATETAQTNRANTSAMTATFDPQTGSQALGNASGTPPLRNFNRQIRSVPANEGHL